MTELATLAYNEEEEKGEAHIVFERQSLLDLGGIMVLYQDFRNTV